MVYWASMKIHNHFIAVTIATALAFAQAPAELSRAQQRAKAKATNVPEIPYDSVPIFLTCCRICIWAKASASRPIPRATSSSTRAASATRLFEFDQKGTFVREIGEGLYGFAFAHAVRVDPQDNIWAVDEGTNMVIKFNPRGQGP